MSSSTAAGLAPAPPMAADVEQKSLRRRTTLLQLASAAVPLVMWFVAPSEVGKLYSREGQHQPVSGVTGFWMFLPLIGFIIWVVKVQGALNRFWESKGATA